MYFIFDSINLISFYKMIHISRFWRTGKEKGMMIMMIMMMMIMMIMMIMDNDDNDDNVSIKCLFVMIIVCFI